MELLWQEGRPSARYIREELYPDTTTTATSECPLL
jgi:hypothetical protein